MPFTPDQVLFLDEDNVYGADELGLPYRDIMGEGVVSATDFAVSERGAGANLSVDVAAGACWIKGDDSATLQPTYRYREAATTNLAIATADPTNPRIDIVIAEIRDATFAGVNKDGRLRVITGTPAGSPTPPATPNNAIKLADVSVPALDTTITNNQITDKRPRAKVGGGLSAAADPFPAPATTLPGSPFDGQMAVLTDSLTLPTYQWVFRYHAGSSQTDKWEFVGGAPAQTEVATAETTASTTYTALTTAGPSFTIPNAGVYQVAVEASMSASSLAAILMSYDIGGTGAVDADACESASGSTANVLSVINTRVKTLTAVTLTAKYKTSAGTATISRRHMRVLPIRVS